MTIRTVVYHALNTVFRGVRHIFVESKSFENGNTTIAKKLIMGKMLPSRLGIVAFPIISSAMQVSLARRPTLIPFSAVHGFPSSRIELGKDKIIIPSLRDRILPPMTFERRSPRPVVMWAPLNN